MLLSLRDISFSYGRGGSAPFVLEHLDLAVDSGDFAIITGASGSGKSTILRIICRLLEPASGTIHFKGAPVTGLRPAVLRSAICYVPQVPVMTDGTVAENLLLPFAFAANRKKTPPSAAAVRELLDGISLAGIDPGQSAQQLSVGQKQRLALLRALLQEPDILLLDEPTSALDPETATQVFSKIERQHLSAARSTIMVTHSDFRPATCEALRLVLRNRKLEPA